MKRQNKRGRKPLHALGAIVSSVLVAATALAACTSDALQVYTAQGSEAAVSRFKTFAILIPEADEMEQANMRPEVMKQFAELSVQRMQSLGYQPIAASQADLWLGFSPRLDTLRSIRTYTPSGREEDATDHRGMAEGTLKVSFVDVKAKQIVLERVANARVDLGVSEQGMNDAVAAIFKDVPRAAVADVPAPQPAAAATPQSPLASGSSPPAATPQPSVAASEPAAPPPAPER
jgi:uncharacterized protein DUF4136